MNILFVMEQWCDCNPACGISGTHHFYLQTWKSCGLGEHREVNYEHRPPSETMAAVRELCDQQRPDLVLFTECWGRESATGLAPLWPELESKNIPVVAVWHDTARAGVWRDLDGIRCNVAVDLPQVRVPMRNSVALWVPQNPNLFFDTPIPRDIAVLYAGSRSPAAKPGAMDRIRSLGCEVLCAGGPREDRLDWSEYASLYRRAKISLNLSRLPDGKPQVKCRVWETICSNAMLLEESNTETAQWLKPGVDYVEYYSQRDCAEKIRYYLKHEDERLAIARSGYMRSQSQYSPMAWWMAVLAAAKVPLPQLTEQGITGMYD